MSDRLDMFYYVRMSLSFSDPREWNYMHSYNILG